MNSGKDSLNGKELVTQAERAAVINVIWEQRKQGRTVHDIAMSLGMPASTVRKHIEVSFSEWREDNQGSVAQEMALDLARLNELIAQNMEIAKSIKVAVARQTVEGQPYTDSEYTYCVDAGKLVISAIQEKGKMLEYAKGVSVNQNNIMIWNASPPERKVIEVAKGPDPSDFSFDP